MLDEVARRAKLTFDEVLRADPMVLARHGMVMSRAGQ